MPQSGAGIAWTKKTEPGGREAQKSPDNAKKGPRKAKGRPKGRPKENMGIKDMGEGHEGSRLALALL